MENNLWHTITFKKVEYLQKTNIKEGLTEKEAKIRQKKFGLNKIPEKKSLTDLAIFLNQFKNLFIIILIVAAIVLWFKDKIDSLVIFLVVFFNALIGFFQERKAGKIFESLKKILKIQARIIRENKEKIVDAENLVPGDIVVLTAGDKVPADGRIFESRGLRINEMVLTGEFLSSLKHSDSLPEKTVLADRENMVYMGTVVEEGRGKMIVTEIGQNTEIGKISQEIEEIEKKTPLQKKIKNLSIFIAILVSILVLIVFFIGISRRLPLLLALEIAIALAVSSIPEGLPIAITIILALGAQRILTKRGLMRNLASIETLGSTSIILTDKTLTLTEGKMEISEIVGDEIKVIKGAVATSDAFVENPQDPKENWIIRGRPMEKIILKKAIEKGLEKEKLIKNKLFDFPFDPQKKFSAICLKKNGGFLIYLCGAPEKILALSKNQKNWEEKIEKAAGRGLRVLGVAEKKTDVFEGLEKEIEKNNFEFLGFITFKDPLKKSVKEAIEIAKEAGARPIIVSGDHKLTVKAVAEELGMNIKDDDILDGSELDTMSESELENVIPRIKIFARTEPKQKLRICRIWQKRGEVVAMTGDGVNDAPALSAADIGIAVGSGTEVAKEAADLILLEDDFQVIEEAIREGRRVLDNARKSILFMCSECFSEIVLVFSAFLLGLPLPILPIQILWKNFVEGSPQGMAFAFEPEERGIMQRKPESLNIPLLTKEMKYLILFAGLITDIILVVFFVILLKNFAIPIERMRTFSLAALALGSFFYAFSCKNMRKNIWEYNPLSNNVLNVTVFLGFLMLLAAIYLPPLQFLLKTVPIGYFEWTFLLTFGILNLLIFEIVKYFLKRKQR